ncbi:MAG TPA: hypothetical protein VJM08_09685 [Anaerolineales bacterium]|nr:hypothetical protein [Anaerolineales bacterium]
MKKTCLTFAILIALGALLLNFQPARAHESVTIGDYEVVYGWVDEPPVVGQMNGVEIFVTNTTTNEPVEENVIQSLTVNLTYGGESKTLTLEPGFEEPGAFRATVLPTIPGVYSIKFGGTLGETAADTEVELEEVRPPDAVQFPVSYPGPQSVEPASTESANSGGADWLVWLSLLVGLIGVGLGITALRKK